MPESLKTGVGCSFYLGSSEHEAWPAASSPRRKRKARGRAWREAIQRTPPWLQTMASKTWSESPSTRVLARPQELDVVALRKRSKNRTKNIKRRTTNGAHGAQTTPRGPRQHHRRHHRYNQKISPEERPHATERSSSGGAVFCLTQGSRRNFGHRPPPAALRRAADPAAPFTG